MGQEAALEAKHSQTWETLEGMGDIAMGDPHSYTCMEAPAQPTMLSTQRNNWWWAPWNRTAEAAGSMTRSP